MPQAYTCLPISGQVSQRFLNSPRQEEFSTTNPMFYSTFFYTPGLDIRMHHTRKKKLERCAIILVALQKCCPTDSKISRCMRFAKLCV